MLDDVRDLASYRLAVLVGLNDRAAHALVKGEFGLTLGEWRVLGNIHARASLTLIELARAMSIDRGQISRTVAGLVERGLVQAREPAHDRRTLMLSMTASGRRLHARMLKFAVGRNEHMLNALSASERRALDGILDKLLAYVNAEHAQLARRSAPASNVTTTRSPQSRVAT